MELTEGELAERVAAALQASVMPSVIARGGEFRVLGVEDGTATLEIGGSPGASLPLLGRIEHLVRKAVPEIARVRLVGPRGDAQESRSADLADRVRDILDREINPVIAAHRGQATLVEIDGGWVRLRLDGGCQGCSLAEVTLRQGIEPLLRERVPGVIGLTDLTDHQAGRDPYYSPAKR